MLNTIWCSFMSSYFFTTLLTPCFTPHTSSDPTIVFSTRLSSQPCGFVVYITPITPLLYNQFARTEPWTIRRFLMPRFMNQIDLEPSASSLSSSEVRPKSFTTTAHWCPPRCYFSGTSVVAVVGTRKNIHWMIVLIPYIC